MRRPHLAALALLLLLPTTAVAGPHLRWQECYRGALATMDRSFTCDRNTGAAWMVGSLWAPDSIPHVIAFEFTISIASASPAIPDWWAFRNPGACRQTSMALVLVGEESWTTCVDRYQSNAVGAIANYQIGVGGAPNRARLVAVAAMPPELAFGIGPSSGETFVYKLHINHLRTVGSPSCEGCDVPMCLAVDNVKVLQPPGEGDYRYTAYSSGDSDWFVTWQGGGGIQGDCPGAVPARNATWGSLKSLYR